MTTTHHPSPQVSAEIPAVPLTTEGYSVLHQMMRLRWPAWRALPASEKSAIAKEASDALAAMEKHSAGTVRPVLAHRPQGRPHADPLPRDPSPT